MNFLHQFDQLIFKLSRAFGLLAGGLCLAMIAVVFVDVLARYAFGGGSVAMQELEWHLFAAMFLLGAAYTMRQNANVRIDVLYAKMSVQKKAWVDILGTLFFVLPMCSLILYSSMDFVGYAYQIKEISPDPGGLPYRYLIKATLPLAYFLVLLEALALIARNLLVLAGAVVPAFAPDVPPLPQGGRGSGRGWEDG